MKNGAFNLDTIYNKKKQTIGVDIDNVLFEIPIMDHVNRVFGSNYTMNDFKDWSFSNLPEIVRQEIFAAFSSSEFMCNTKPYWNNYCTIRDWHMAGHKLYAITRRSLNLIEGTRKQLEKHYPGLFEDFIFVTKNDSKARWLKEINATIHIDDWDVEDSLDAGIPTMLITNENTPYNWNLRKNPNLYQASSLQHVIIDHSKWNSEIKEAEKPLH